MSVWSDRHSW